MVRDLLPMSPLWMYIQVDNSLCDLSRNRRVGLFPVRAMVGEYFGRVEFRNQSTMQNLQTYVCTKDVRNVILIYLHYCKWNL
jgi:hypothetical protein